LRAFLLINSAKRVPAAQDCSRLNVFGGDGQNISPATEAKVHNAGENRHPGEDKSGMTEGRPTTGRQIPNSSACRA